MTRSWLLTWTTYGTWLPGDVRGFVSGVRDAQGRREVHNLPGTPYDADLAALRDYAASIQRQESVWLTARQADELAMQFHETARIRRWFLHAFAVMANHVHLVVEADDVVWSKKILSDFKSYGCRRLRDLAKNKKYIPWTEKGSRRRLCSVRARDAAIRYVHNQSRPLVVYIADQPS